MATTPPGKLANTLGWTLTALTALMLVGTATVKLIGTPAYVEQTESIGWTEGNLTTLASIQLAISAIYLFPKTAVLGATLIVGYYGGAVAAYVRLDQPDWPVPLAFGIIAWLALFLRYPALQKLTPLTK